MNAPVIAETRPGHGIPADWLSPDTRLSPGRWVKGSRHHQRVEAIEKDLGLWVRCHDCGYIARAAYRKAVYDELGCVVPERNPLPWALDSLDGEPCEPLGVQPLFDLGGAVDR